MIIPILTAITLSQPGASISNYVQGSFDSAHFFVNVGKADFNELKKVNMDFSQSYRFKSSEVWIKEPFKLKMESKVQDMKITFIVNGGRKVTRVPDRHINISDDVSQAPGKRQTMFDFGMLSPALVKDFFQAKFVRNDRATNAVVFDLTYIPTLKDTSRYRVWIDPEKKMIIKREWYGQQSTTDGRLMATFNYSNAKKINGVWVSTAVSVYNADQKLAGQVTYDRMEINTAIPDDLFKL